jgi:tetratricopeptide (TPR) repeat protein
MHEFQYENFDLQIISKGNDEYLVQVKGEGDDPYNEKFSAKGFEYPFHLDPSRPVQSQYRDLGFESERRPHLQSAPSDIKSALNFGRQLSAAVFQAKIYNAYEQCLKKAGKSGVRLRIDLKDALELEALPWEYLLVPSTEQFFAISVRYPIVRYPRQVRKIERMPISLPLRILVIVSSPREYPRLDVERETSLIESEIKKLKGKIQLERLFPPTLKNLEERLDRSAEAGSIHIIHFIGHGEFEPAAKDGVLLMEKSERYADPVRGRNLGQILNDYNNLQLVVINACEGGAATKSEFYNGVAQNILHTCDIPAVIAMRHKITDHAAIAFSEGFYGALAKQYPIDVALCKARKAMMTDSNHREDLEYLTPVLYMQSPDGRIFENQESIDEVALETSATENDEISNIELMEAENYIEPGETLSEIFKNFLADQRILSLTGMPGIGKTMTAKQYAWKYRRAYRKVLWAKAETREDLQHWYWSIASHLKLNLKETKKEYEIVEVIDEWAKKNAGWLLILDYVKDMKDVENYILKSDNGSILLTTRSSISEDGCKMIMLKSMSIENGVQFLLSELAGTSCLSGFPEDDEKQASALTKELGGLPLALKQAAAYAKKTGISLKDYLIQYKRESKVVLSKPIVNKPGDHISVSVSFNMAFDQITELSPVAANLMRVCALLDGDAMPKDIFSVGAAHLGEGFEPLYKNLDDLNDAITIAKQFSLLDQKLDKSETMLSIHPVVQTILLDRMEVGERTHWASLAVRAVCRAFPEDVHVGWRWCNLLILQAQKLSKTIKQFEFSFPEATTLLHRAGKYLQEEGRYKEAETIYLQCLEILKKGRWEEDPQTGVVLKSMANLHFNQRDYQRAERLLNESLSVYQKQTGENSREIANIYSSLAAIHIATGRPEQLDEAERLLTRSLAINEKLPFVPILTQARNWNTLAGLKMQKKDYAGALSHYLMSLELFEKNHDPEYGPIADTLFHLARLHYEQKEYEKAIPYIERCIGIYKIVYRAGHPKLVEALRRFAKIYEGLRRYEDAFQSYNDALAICEMTDSLGPNHDIMKKLEAEQAEILYYLTHSDSEDRIQ